MRIAILSDIHGNLTALQAVLGDLRDAAPDLVLQGGDLADGGSAPAEVVDIVRGLGWPSVTGNGEQMLCAPETLQAFAAASPAPPSIFVAVEQMAAWTRAALGADRLAWLATMPLTLSRHSLTLVHASPEDPWRAPAANVSDEALAAAFGPLQTPLVVYGHIHQGFVRQLDTQTVANAGSVGLSYDGDPRASYLLIDGDAVTLRRVAYDVETEQHALAACGLPHSGWVTRMITTARPQLP